MNITKCTQRKLAKLASSLPRGDEGRRAILAALKGATIVERTASEGVPRPFKREDWFGWAGAEEWSKEEPPWILEMDFRGDLSDSFEFGGRGYVEDVGVNTQYVVAIADSEGIGLYFNSDDGDQGPMFHKNQRMEPEEAEGALKAVARHLKSGRLPPGYKHTN